MRPGEASRTAELVCMGRAAAHGRTPVQRFSDPTALALLGDEARARVEAYRTGGEKPRGLRARFAWEYLDRQSKAMVVRTVTIDDAVRDARAEQVVILGAGLDGRAWRMPELRDALVFEVDHPDSQRAKRERAAKLAQHAREVRFVPVDFTRDRLDDALAAAGHDAAKTTTWIWEGVVMYLTRHEVDATLEVIAARSAKGSRLVVAYHQPGAMLLVIGLFVRRLGEPLRSSFTPAEMRAQLGAHGFSVLNDDDVAHLGRMLAPELGRPTSAVRHLRIVIAEKH